MNKDGHVLNAALLSVGLGIILSVSPDMQPTVAVARDAAVTLAQITIPVVLGALLPDIDTAFGRHRKTLHNVFVLGLFVAYPVYFGNLQFVWIGVATHLVLDYFGSKRGIALFYPLSDAEYDFPTGVATSSRWARTATLLITAVELGVLAAIHFYAVPLDADVGNVIGALPLG